MKHVAIFGGNTLGHVIPGVTIGNVLSLNYQVIYITPAKFKDHSLLKKASFKSIYCLDIHKLSKIYEIVAFVNIYKQIREILKKEQIDTVISFGSYLGTIGILAGKSLKLTTIIHEQNAVIGLGNKLVHKNANYFLSNYKLKNYKTIVVGNPTFVDLTNNKVQINHRKVVIVSGTNGSNVINQLAVLFLKSNYHYKFHTTVITGLKYYEKIKNQLPPSLFYQIIPFMPNLSDFIKDAKIVVSRAGATTLSELKALNKKAIIIPSPNVKGNHQEKNALNHLDEFIILNEKDLTLDNFINGLKEIEKKSPILNKQNSTKLFIEAIEDA